jgi:hypothetical protein
VNLHYVREGVPYDNTFVLGLGEHDFAQRPSFVICCNARIETEKHAPRSVEQGLFKPHMVVSVTVRQPIKSEPLASPHTKCEFKRFKF